MPEPLVTGGADDPAGRAELADSLSLAFLVLLESLSPEQRAVLLLRDVFDYGYEEIAGIVGKSAENVRQMAVRARCHVAERRPRYETSPPERDQLARRFFAAARDGDLASLEKLLAADVALHGDGGGKVPALARSLHGCDRVLRTLMAWKRQGDRMAGTAIHEVEVNGRPGALLFDGAGRVIGVMALQIADGQIQAIRSIVNPEKLGHLGAVADLRGLLERRGEADPS